MNSNSLFDRLDASGRLPTPPGVVLRLLELTKQADTSPREIADAVALDPGLAAKILRFVNSPLAGVRHEVTSLPQAVTLVGARGVSMMALSFSMLSPRDAVACDRFDYHHFALYSLTCGAAAKALSGETRVGWTQEAFVAGLLSQLGRLALAVSLREEYSRVLAAARRVPEDLPALERAALGETYATVGAWLLRRWAIPEELCRAIEVFRETNCPGEPTELAEILEVAEQAASVICPDPHGEPPDSGRFIEAARRRFALDTQQSLDVIGAASTELENVRRILDLPAARLRSVEQIEAEVRERLAELTVAMHLENQAMVLHQEDLLRRATTDALTGVGNRAAFDARLFLELERAARSEGPFALLMIDADMFKKFNDSYGHQAGDRMLQQIARILDLNVRKVDYVARYGGDEFAVIAPGADEEGITNLAERMRRAVEHTPITWDGRHLKITISVGAVVVTEVTGGDTPRIIRIADEQLYAAKCAGRNRVTIASQRSLQEEARPRI